MAFSVIGFIINGVMLVLIAIIIIIGVSFNSTLKTCETSQSYFCLTMQCPCDSSGVGVAEPPCFGYAKRPAEKDGQWYCSNAPLTVVDNSGNIV
jgi:hypothetical protein